MSSLAVDVGGTYIKAAIIDQGRLGDVVRAPVPAFLDTSGALGEPGHAREIDAGALDDAVRTVIADVSSTTALKGRVFISGQMAGLAFVDDSGEALAPLISWQDTRFTDVAGVARALGSSAAADLGDGLRVGSPLVTLAAHEHPAGAHVTSLLGYVAGRIALTRAQVLHTTDAGSWGLWDTRRGQWSEFACRVARVDPGHLPSVSAGIVPIAPGLSVMVAVGDQQAALLGAGLEQGWVSVNLATGCQVSVLADAFDDSVQTRPYFGEASGGRFLRTVTHLPAGRLLAAALRDARGSEDWEWLAEPGRAFDAIDEVVRGITEAVIRLQATGRPVRFTGGVVQRLPALQERIATELRAPRFDVFPGDDAALNGLAVLESHSG